MSEKKTGRKYMPPEIKEIGGTYEQALGISAGCTRGAGDGLGCANGRSATGNGCDNGPFAAVGDCANGPLASGGGACANGGLAGFSGCSNGGLGT